MGLRYNPFTGSFDLTRSPGSYLDGEVATYGDLPLDTAAAPLNSAWLVRGASGLWLLSRKPAGIYIRTATGGTDRDADYTYAGTFPDVFSDANFVVYNDADSTKNVKLDASAITTGTTRTLTVPDKSGTIATTSDLPDDYTVVSTAGNLANGDRVAANTTSAAFTLTLPASPANGDTIYVLDYAGTFASNNLTIARNGNNIESLAEDLVCNVEKAAFSLVYAGSTVGWKVVPQTAVMPSTSLANTWQVNQTFNGTNNTAPNQTSASGSSILTRDLGDARFLNKLRSVQYNMVSGWSNLTTTGGFVGQTPYGLNVLGASASNAGSATAYVFGERTGIGQNKGDNFASIDFANPLAANIFLTTRSFNFPAQCDWAFIFGSTETSAAGIANMVKTGTSNGIGWVGLQCISGNVTIIATNGTSAVASSGVVDTWVNGHNHKGYRIAVSGGSVSVTSSEGALLGTLSSGAPTFLKLNSGPHILVQASAATNQIGVTVQHLSFDW